MTSEPSTEPLPGQYEYASFQAVLISIRRLVLVQGPRLAVAFERYIRQRNYYLEEKKDPEVAHIIECLIKSHVGVRRLGEDFPEMFERVRNIGRKVDLKVSFWDGAAK